MNISSRNEAGWAKDEILTGQIMDVLDGTKEKDFIYTISVQGHGDYPTSDQSGSPIQVTGEGFSESYLNQLTYYANQTREMDDFIRKLLEKLSDYPEDTMVIAYGDHLPGMNFESKDLTGGSKYETPYFIWDNFGYNRRHKEEQDETLPAYRLASKVLGEMNISNGILNRFHQGMAGTKKYRSNLKMLQYDMLYGSDFISRNEETREASTLHFGFKQPKVTQVKQVDDSYLLIGEHYTAASRIYVNGILVPSEVLSPTVIKVAKNALKDGDMAVVHQVSETNEKITLNTSEEYEFHEYQVKPLYRQEDAS